MEALSLVFLRLDDFRPDFPVVKLSDVLVANF